MPHLPAAVESSLRAAFKRFADEIGFYVLFLSKMMQPGFRVTKVETEEQMIVEALAVKIYTSWEVFVADIMIDCLSCDTTQHAKDMGIDIPQHLPRGVCELMLAGTGILSLGNASDIQSVAKRRLVPAHNPFKEIDRADISKINEFQKIRNYIAHQSRLSRLSLEGIYRLKYKIEPFIAPGLFLATHIKVPESEDEAARLSIYLRAFLNAADKMKGHLLPDESIQRH